MTRKPILVAILAASIAASLAMGPAQAQTAAPKAATAVASAGKTLYPQAQFDTLLKQRIQQGQPDTPEMRSTIREELNTRELLAREAKKANLDKSAEVKTQMDLASQTVLVSAFVADWVKKNPIPEAELRKEYEVIKAQIGDKEYHVKHILVEKEDDAKDIIVQLQKGAKFDELAKARSKDTGSKDKGGDLDWNAPAGFVKPFSDAMVKLEKGKFTATPVQTQFGWHVIKVEDRRKAAKPTLEQLTPQLGQQLYVAKSRGRHQACGAA